MAYYNDRFDLRAGDIVFVGGKLEGLRGRVTAISTRFKIKAEYYIRYDEDGFPLDDLSKLEVSEGMAERGLAYCQENRVSQLCLKGS